MARDEQIAKQIAAYIKCNMDRPLHICDLTAQFYLSKFTLERIFKKVFHQTLHQFILEERLKEARKLLTTTNIPIKEIVYKVGFKSITTFTLEFHQKFDITPAALRDKL